MLGAELFDAELAERYGWINRALPADELDAFVDRLARNIAALPEGVIVAAKHAIVPDDLAAALVRENNAWAGLVFRPVVGQLISGGLAAGAQTRDGERDLEALMRNSLLTFNSRMAAPVRRVHATSGSKRRRAG